MPEAVYRALNQGVSTSGKSSTNCVRRMALETKLEQRQTSLTPHEISFVRELLDSGGDVDLDALENSLRDDALFFHPFEKQAGTNERCQKAEGSTRRLTRVEKRRYCQTQAGLWKQASLKVVATNRFHKTLAGTKPTPSSPHPTSEKQSTNDWTFHCIDEESEAQDREDNHSQIVFQHNEPKSDVPIVRRGLMTRRASENLYHGEGFEVGAEELFSMYSTPQYDPWDEETDRSGHQFDFHILGTSHHDMSALPHVLSPPIMHALQAALPMQHQGESFWLKYSLVRDGASIMTFLQNLRGSTNTLMAMETVDGEVFGAFTSSAWTVQPSFFGKGDSFLWRMTHSRAEVASSVLEQAKRETDLEIFNNSHLNLYEQICQHDKIVIGAGTPASAHMIATGVTLQPEEFGFGIAFEGDSLIEASSEACVTFNSPALSNIHSDGSKFELVNLEVWTLTPSITEEEARRMECNNLFLKRHVTCSF